MERPVLALLTDFGTLDPYVGVLKGVALSINPRLTIIDITHEVRPQAIAQGSFLLAASYRYLPPGTIVVAVVDPGVGTARRPLLLAGPEYTFVAPDNGLLSGVIVAEAPHLAAAASDTVPPPPGWRAVELTQPRFWRHPVSSTFHGRDVFTPSAAHASLGTPPEVLGTPVARMTFLPPAQPRRDTTGLTGQVAHVDRYGNLITNIPQGLLPAGEVEVLVGGRRVHGLHRSYQEGEHLVAVVGSYGTLEVAVRNGNAAAELGVDIGAPVTVRPR